MNIYYFSYFVAMGLGLYATYLFLKASSIFARYNESLKRISKGQASIASWRFIIPLKENKLESSKMKEGRLNHKKFISRYWFIVLLMFVMVSFTAMSAKY